MALYGVFFWTVVFMFMAAYLYLKFLRNEIERHEFLVGYTLSLTAIITGIIVSFSPYRRKKSFSVV